MNEQMRVIAEPLPPGQRKIDHFPRYGLFQYANRIERETAPLELRLEGDVRQPITLDSSFLETLPRVSENSDMHCITTWTKRDIHWSGIRFKDFFEQIVLPQVVPDKDIQFVVFYARDEYRTYFVLKDILASDVLLADKLDSAPLTWEHGAPLRLVAPAHYGFRSAKHLQRIEFCRTLNHYRSPGMHWTEDRRARVAFEERGRFLPGWLYRYLFRAVIPAVLWWYRRAEKRSTNTFTRTQHSLLDSSKEVKMKLLTSDNSELMEVSRLKSEGNNLIVVGTIMGAMPVEAVLTPAQLRQAFKLLSLGILLFIISMLFKK